MTESGASPKPPGPRPRRAAANQAWLADLTRTLTSVARTTHSQPLYDAMGARAGVDLRPYLFGVLTRIYDLQPVRVSDVADQMDYDRSTVSRHVAELVNHGCVDRSADPGDGRVVILRLSEFGEQIVNRIFDAWIETLAEVTGSWSADERRAFLTLLRQFEGSLDTYVAKL
jgi:DNA-binding MarR family transcriptional regulator